MSVGLVRSLDQMHGASSAAFLSEHDTAPHIFENKSGKNGKINNNKSKRTSLSARDGTLSVVD